MLAHPRTPSGLSARSDPLSTGIIRVGNPFESPSREGPFATGELHEAEIGSDHRLQVHPQALPVGCR